MIPIINHLIVGLTPAKEQQDWQHGEEEEEEGGVSDEEVYEKMDEMAAKDGAKDGAGLD